MSGGGERRKSQEESKRTSLKEKHAFAIASLPLFEDIFVLIYE